MEERKNNTLLTVVITLLVVAVLGLGGYIVYDKIVKKEENPVAGNSVPVDETIDEKTSETEKKEEVYKNYNIGDTVQLKDNSSNKWNVLENSDSNSQYVTLMSVNNINNNYTIKIKDAKSYLMGTYKQKLVEALNLEDGDIKEIRLLTLEDISNLTGIKVEKLVAGTSIENQNTPKFLYSGVTLTNAIEIDCPVLVCDAEDDGNNSARICISTGTDTEPIRPILTIDKKYLK